MNTTNNGSNYWTIEWRGVHNRRAIVELIAEQTGSPGEVLLYGTLYYRLIMPGYGALLGRYIKLLDYPI